MKPNACTAPKPPPAATPPRGLACPNPACRSTASRVLHTRPHRGVVRRFRKCKACGKEYRTAERTA